MRTVEASSPKITATAAKRCIARSFFVNRIGKELVVEAVGAARVSTREFAGLLRSYEHTLSADPPDRVVLADDSDAALAAAIVASKLLIPLESRVNASEAANPNGALIARLAGA